MPGKRHCFIPYCKTGYNSDRKLKKAEGKKVCSLFGPPKDCLELWKKRIPRKDKEFSMKDAVCELHFPPECIERFYTTLLKDGTVHMLPRGKAALKAGTVPSIFPKGPLPSVEKFNSKEDKVSSVKHNNITVKPSARKTNSNRKFNVLAEKHNETSSSISKDISTAPILLKNTVRRVSSSEISVERNPSDIKKESDFHVSNNSDLFLTNPSLIPIENPDRDVFSTSPQLCDSVDIGNAFQEKVYVLNINEASFDNNPSDVTNQTVEEDVPSTFKEIAVLTIYPNHEQFSERTNHETVSQNSNKHFNSEEHTLPIEVETVKDFCFDVLRENAEKIKNPSHWWAVWTCHPEFVVYVKWDRNISAERKVIINSNLDIKIFIKDKEMEPLKDVPTSIEDVSAILKKVNSYRICAGASSNSQDCLVILPPLLPRHLGPRRSLCVACARYRKKLSNKKWYYTHRTPKVQKENWQQKFHNESRKNLRLQKKVKRLKRLLEVEKTCSAAALEFIS